MYFFCELFEELIIIETGRFLKQVDGVRIEQMLLAFLFPLEIAPCFQKLMFTFVVASKVFDDHLFT